MKAYEVITFDCYGTLIDWEAGIRKAFATAHPGAERLDDVLSAYARAEASVEAEAYRPYRAVLGESARRAARELGWQIAPGQEGFLAESLPEWQPFPDTNAALTRLKDAGFELGILSNVDEDLLAATLRHLDVDFDFVVTAEQVRSYKPAIPHFQTARTRIGEKHWLHAAQSSRHDIVPANALGIPTAWINRKSMQALPGGNPTMEFATLRELAEALTTERSPNSSR